jgi:hypothetical protein
MSESTEQTTNNESTETKNRYEAVEYLHGGNIKFPDGIERGFFANSKPGEKDGIELAQKLCAELNELSSLREKLANAEQVERALRMDLEGECNARAEAEAKLVEAESKLAKIAEATANA